MKSHNQSNVKLEKQNDVKLNSFTCCKIFMSYKIMYWHVQFDDISWELWILKVIRQQSVMVSKEELSEFYENVTLKFEEVFNGDMQIILQKKNASHRSSSDGESNVNIWFNFGLKLQ